MRIKSFYGSTVEDAMAVASAELGEEAMLVNSRRTSVETRHLGEYEVIIVTDVAAGESDDVRAAVQGTQSGLVRKPPADRLTVEVGVEKGTGGHAEGTDPLCICAYRLACLFARPLRFLRHAHGRRSDA